MACHRAFLLRGIYLSSLSSLYPDPCQKLFLFSNTASDRKSIMKSLFRIIPAKKKTH